VVAGDAARAGHVFEVLGEVDKNGAPQGETTCRPMRISGPFELAAGST
jgi:hypothetical protein